MGIEIFFLLIFFYPGAAESLRGVKLFSKTVFCLHFDAP